MAKVLGVRLKDPEFKSQSCCPPIVRMSSYLLQTSGLGGSLVSMAKCPSKTIKEKIVTSGARNFEMLTQ